MFSIIRYAVFPILSDILLQSKRQINTKQHVLNLFFLSNMTSYSFCGVHSTIICYVAPPSYFFPTSSKKIVYSKATGPDPTSSFFFGHLAALWSVFLQRLHLFFLFDSAFIPFLNLFSFLRPLTFDLGGFPTPAINALAPSTSLVMPTRAASSTPAKKESFHHTPH